MAKSKTTTDASSSSMSKTTSKSKPASRSKKSATPKKAAEKKTTTNEKSSALEKFKYEVASELGVPLKKGYNGDLTSKQSGSIGGTMVKKMIAEQMKKMS